MQILTLNFPEASGDINFKTGILVDSVNGQNWVKFHFNCHRKNLGPGTTKIMIQTGENQDSQISQ
jgi:hypothetical protein